MQFYYFRLFIIGSIAMGCETLIVVSLQLSVKLSTLDLINHLTFRERNPN